MKVTALRMGIRGKGREAHRVRPGAVFDMPESEYYLRDKHGKPRLGADGQPLTCAWVRAVDPPGKPPASGGAPEDPAARTAAIRAAIEGLEKGAEGQWTSDGRPDARALTQKLGSQVTSAERDAVWEEMQKGARLNDRELI